MNASLDSTLVVTGVGMVTGWLMAEVGFGRLRAVGVVPPGDVAELAVAAVDAAPPGRVAQAGTVLLVTEKAGVVFVEVVGAVDRECRMLNRLKGLNNTCRTKRKCYSTVGSGMKRKL